MGFRVVSTIDRRTWYFFVGPKETSASNECAVWLMEKSELTVGISVVIGIRVYSPSMSPRMHDDRTCRSTLSSWRSHGITRWTTRCDLMRFPQVIGRRLRSCFDINATFICAQKVAGYWYNFILRYETLENRFSRNSAKPVPPPRHNEDMLPKAWFPRYNSSYQVFLC